MHLFELHKIRQATPQDVKLYFNWVNEPDVRKNAVNSKKISFEDHIKWFNTKLNSTDSYLFVLEQNKTPMGQIRFDRDRENIFWIDYSIDKDYREKGIGIILLNKGILELRATIEALKIKAIVKETNLISRKTFKKTNFQHVGFQVITNQKYFEFLLY